MSGAVEQVRPAVVAPPSRVVANEHKKTHVRHGSRDIAPLPQRANFDGSIGATATTTSTPRPHTIRKSRSSEIFDVTLLSVDSLGGRHSITDEDDDDVFSSRRRRNHERNVSFSDAIRAATFHTDSPPSRKRTRFHSSVASLISGKLGAVRDMSSTNADDATPLRRCHSGPLAKKVRPGAAGNISSGDNAAVVLTQPLRSILKSQKIPASTSYDSAMRVDPLVGVALSILQCENLPRQTLWATSPPSSTRHQPVAALSLDDTPTATSTVTATPGNGASSSSTSTGSVTDSGYFSPQLQGQHKLAMGDAQPSMTTSKSMPDAVHSSADDLVSRRQSMTLRLDAVIKRLHRATVSERVSPE